MTMPLRCLAALFLGLGMLGQGRADDRLDYGLLDRALQAVDAQGRVDYTALKRDAQDLDAFVAQIAVVGPDTRPDWFLTRADSMAYWINAYNALVLKGVVAAYPVASVTDISPFFGFFKRRTFRVDGRDLTLDQIENDRLRKGFADPRIHAAINCAAASCPRLRQKVFRPDSLDVRLTEAMKDMVRSSKHVRLDQGENALYLSKIFDWFASDFTDWYMRDYYVKTATIVDFLRVYLPESESRYLARHSDVKIVFLKYDWALNATPGAP